MMTLFSMLFGAGLVLMGERADQRGASLRGVYYRRVPLAARDRADPCLLDLVRRHPGDVRRVRPDHLPVPALAAQDADPRRRRLPLRGRADRDGLRGGDRLPRRIRRRRRRPRRRPASSRRGSRRGSTTTCGRPRSSRGLDPDAPKKKEEFEKAITIHRGGYVGIVKDRAKELLIGQTMGFILGGFWLAGGRMLIGMGLMKLGVFSGRRSRRFYVWLVAPGIRHRPAAGGLRRATS